MLTQAQIEDRYFQIEHRIQTAAQQAGRSSGEITLIGASKKQTAALLGQFLALGLHDLGENYLQEAIEKQDTLNASDVCWHFIGGIQSRKSKQIAEHFEWVHGIDRNTVAEKLSRHRLESIQDKPINGLIQINVDAQESKSGVSLSEISLLVEKILSLPGIHLRGLMLLPAPRDTVEEQRQVFARARNLLDQLNSEFDLVLDTLSMGMSGDLEAAILEGSTMVRIGTDLFGPRPV
ncbi:MAG: YggS family pyridoxal phosphate-dependent enzyme [Pseudomonadota bacterium]